MPGPRYREILQRRGPPYRAAHAVRAATFAHLGPASIATNARTTHAKGAMLKRVAHETTAEQPMLLHLEEILPERCSARTQAMTPKS